VIENNGASNFIQLIHPLKAFLPAKSVITELAKYHLFDFLLDSFVVVIKNYVAIQLDWV
jgi:hypothetical protein